MTNLDEIKMKLSILILHMKSDVPYTVKVNNPFDKNIRKPTTIYLENIQGLHKCIHLMKNTDLITWWLVVCNQIWKQVEKNNI